MHARIAPRDLALILVIVTLWGFAFVPIKWVLAEIPPFMLAALRFLFAAVPAMFLVARPAMPWRSVVAYGIAIGVLQYGLMFLGLHLGMPAGLASLVMQLQVFFTIALTVAFAGDRLHRWNVAGAVVAFAGIGLLAAFKLEAGATVPLAGFVALIGGAFAWGVGNLIAKRSANADMFSLVVWSSVVPVPFLVLVSFALEGGTAPFQALARASPSSWGWILYLSWGATLFGFSVWNRLLHRYPAPLVSPFALLIPVAGLASGAVFLRETLAPLQALGVALVFAGLAVNVLGARMQAGWALLMRAGPTRGR
ncbi:MAG: EamA family transporter [Burkholderiales bacterium]|nr:EamA family transporter [Burkholderiales bacterium]GIK86810.1 MAG: O-acetylserine/cysteine exporter [Betaproteobacteria bacterium]